MYGVVAYSKVCQYNLPKSLITRSYHCAHQSFLEIFDSQSQESLDCPSLTFGNRTKIRAQKLEPVSTGEDPVQVMSASKRAASIAYGVGVDTSEALPRPQSSLALKLVIRSLNMPTARNL